MHPKGCSSPRAFLQLQTNLLHLACFRGSSPGKAVTVLAPYQAAPEIVAASESLCVLLAWGLLETSEWIPCDVTRILWVGFTQGFISVKTLLGWFQLCCGDPWKEPEICSFYFLFSLSSEVLLQRCPKILMSTYWAEIQHSAVFSPSFSLSWTDSHYICYLFII